MQLLVTALALGAVPLISAGALEPADRDVFKRAGRRQYDCGNKRTHPLLRAFAKPENSVEASAFCSTYIRSTVTETESATQTVNGISTVTPDAVTVTQFTSTKTDSIPTGTTTVTVTNSNGVPDLFRRSLATTTSFPSFIPETRKAVWISHACSCIVTPPAVTHTTTATVATELIPTNTVVLDPATETVKDVSTTVENVVATATVVTDLVCGYSSCFGDINSIIFLVTDIATFASFCRSFDECEFFTYDEVLSIGTAFTGRMKESIEPGSCPGIKFYDRRCSF